MKKVDRITKFVEEIFDSYGLNKHGFFYEIDDISWDEYPIELFPGGKVTNFDLERISITTGISKQDILNLNYDAAKKYYKKYKFFSLYADYRYAYSWQYNYKSKVPTAEERLIAAIFEQNIYKDAIARYNKEEIKQRALTQLKQLDNDYPGAFHEGADLTEFQYETEEFISYQYCEEMVNSLIEAVEQFKKLFLKELLDELNEEEENELNFLVSFLDVIDRDVPSLDLRYRNIKILKKFYTDECIEHIFEHIKFRILLWTQFWRCKEFYNNTNFVQWYVSILPETKYEIREFSQNIRKIRCAFKWSDQEPVKDEIFADLFNESLNEKEQSSEEKLNSSEYIPFNFVYIEKKPSEYSDKTEVIKKIKQLCGPAKKGGLKLSPFRCKLRPFDRIDRYVRIKREVERNG